MEIQAFQLQQHIKDGLKSVYLLTGDEPLQLMESADQLRTAAISAGFTDRKVIYADASTDWSSVFSGCTTMSLFGDKTLLEIRFASSKPGLQASEMIYAYLQAPPEDTLAILQMPRLDKKGLSAKWVKAVQKNGVMIRVWPLQGNILLRWLEQRLQQAQVKVSEDTARMIASHTEGNMLAAAQEIEKLALLQVDNDEYEVCSQHHTQQSRYTVFDLVDSLLQKNVQRSLSVVQQLKAEATAPTLVIWALTELIRALLMTGPYTGTRIQNTFLFSKKEGLARWNVQNRGSNLSALLMRCARMDRITKGRAIGDTWDEVSRMCVRLCA